ncbi:MAG: hypothetical protein ACKVOR_07120 [Flavobacteriales bacterium]
MKKLILPLAMLMVACLAKAQDIIKLKSGEEIKAKITVVSDEEVQYKEWDYQDGPDFKLSVAKIEYVKFQNGREMKFNAADLLLDMPDDKVLNRKDVVKLSPFSPLFGRTIVGFEHVQRFGLHWEGEMGIIGLGKKEYNDKEEAGLWLSGGPKFLLRKETYMRGQRYLHYLHGSYARPELFIEHYRGEYTVGYGSGISRYDFNTTTFAFMLNVGKQWLMGDRFTMDVYAGGGMASVNVIRENPDDNEVWYYSSSFGSKGIATNDYQGNGEINFALKFGFKIGLAI